MAENTCCVMKTCQAKVKKTVLFCALDTIGHINSLIAIANCLKKRGHRTVFLFHEPIDCGLLKAGHEVYDCSNETLTISDPEAAKKVDKWSKIFVKMDQVMRNPKIELQIEWLKMGQTFMQANVRDKEEIFARKLNLIKPDVLIADQLFYVQPAILKCGKPWAHVYSPSPMGLHPPEHAMSPPFLGLPTKKSACLQDEKLSQDLAEGEKQFELLKEISNDWDKYLAEVHGIDSVKKATIIHESAYLNVYVYPKELDYEQPLENWIQCDSTLRINGHANIDEESDETVADKHQRQFEIPLELRDKPGKLVFLSMGTLASNNVELMKRLVSICSKSPHRFIVSCGPNCDKYELAANMWGQAHVDQLAILPNIDLIITHGGNNTLTECFYYGVPGYIVCPSFGDQKDNAQRIEECKLGKRLDPFNCSEKEFLDAIELILNDPTIKARMKAIQERMQKPESKFKILRVFRDFVEKESFD